jgi:hypothetical protein
MAFRGIYPAPAIEPTEFGLFAVAKPDLTADAKTEDQWTRGFSQEYHTEPNYVRNWDETNATNYVVSSNPASKLYREVKPIFIEVEDYRSTFSLAGEDRMARVKAQLEGVTQKALEYELWNGEIALKQGLPNLFLSHPSVNVIANGTKFSPRRAIALLEHYAGESSPAGEHGVLHLTRDMFILSTSNNQIFMHSQGHDHMQTYSGTLVIIGSGYSGDGPHSLIDTVAVSSNTVTVVTTGAHYLETGETAEIQGTVDGTDFSGQYVVTVTNSTTFTFSKTTANMSATAPDGTATAQMKGNDNTKWIYATGNVQAHLGASEIVNQSLAQGYDVSGNQNDMKIKAVRSAAAYFDPSIHLGVKVDLTA